MFFEILVCLDIGAKKLLVTIDDELQVVKGQCVEKEGCNGFFSLHWLVLK